MVHPDNGISCAARLPMEHTLMRTASLASAWSAKLSRPPSGKLEGEPATCSRRVSVAGCSHVGNRASDAGSVLHLQRIRLQADALSTLSAR